MSCDVRQFIKSILDRYKEENWNLEVSLQELRTQVAELQGVNSRLEVEQKRVNKQLSQARESADKLKGENEILGTSFADLKAKHETDIAQMRRNGAALQRDKSDLQAALDALKVEADKKNRSLRTMNPENARSDPGPISEFEVGSDSHALVVLPPSPLMQPLVSEELEPSDLKLSMPLDQLKGHPEEIESLRRNFLHAQRQIASLKNSLMKEKELRLEQKRKRLALPEHTDSNCEEGEEEGEEQNEEFTSKPKGRRRSRPRKQQRRVSRRHDDGIKKIDMGSVGDSYELVDDVLDSDLVPDTAGSEVFNSVGFNPSFSSTNGLDVEAMTDNQKLASHSQAISHLAQELGIDKPDLSNGFVEGGLIGIPVNPIGK